MNNTPMTLFIPMTLFMLPIGDWGNDGHGKTKTFIVGSNKPLDAVREAYFKATKALPRVMWPTEFMAEYEDHSLPRETYDAMRDHGFHPWPEMDDEELEDRLDEMLEYPQWGGEEMASYVLWFIGQGDVDLKLSIVKIDQLQFYGADWQHRHISGFGYGLFQ